MNCKKCGSPMVLGQTICSNCDFANNVYEDSNINNQLQDYNEFDNNFQNSQDQTNEVQQVNNDLNSMQSYKNVVYNSNDDSSFESNDVSMKKQNIMLRIASILALIASVGMLVSKGGDLFVEIGLGKFSIINLLTLIIPIIMLVGAFFISNFNIGKSAFYDNKIIFVIFLCINFVCGILLKIYFIIFIFSLIGFVISCKSDKNS